MYKPQRVHPLAIIYFAVRKIYSLGQALLPLLIIALAQPEIRKWLLVGIPLLLAFFVIYGILYWLRYVFYISGSELRLEYGVLIRKQRYIPFERIQTVQISAGVVQRLLGLVKVQVETAGGGDKAEFVLAALPRDRAEKLQQILQEGRKQLGKTEDQAEGVEYKLSPRSLLLLASTSNGIGVVISAMLVVISQLNDFFAQLDIWSKVGTYAEHLAAARISLIILAVLLLFLLAWLLSLLGTIIQFGGFQLRRKEGSINISRGLFEKQQITIPIKRIQAIKVVEGLLRQPLGMVSVQVVSISNTGTKGEGNVLFPLLPKAELTALLEQVVPEFAMPLKLQRLPARARRRYLLVNIVPTLIIAVVCAIYLPWGYAAFVLPLLGAWLGLSQYNNAGYRVTDDKLLLRSRILGRVTMIIPRRRIQSLHVSQNPFQARSGLSNLRIAVASHNTAATVQLTGMDLQQSNHIINFLRG
ncbi:MAG: PH domain-containing protein [Syntrophomonadaceae bacterium]|nr:PH domain-containing protein [Syntrophomonadaceae bacterium]